LLHPQYICQGELDGCVRTAFYTTAQLSIQVYDKAGTQVMRLSAEWGNDGEADPMFAFGYFIAGNTERQPRRHIKGF